MKNEKTQDILHTFFTKEVEDLTPLDYKAYVEYHLQNKDAGDEESKFPTLPEGTVVLASGPGHEDQESLVVRTPENIYHLVDEYLGLEEDFDESPAVDPSTPVSELYEISHYGNGTHYHYSSYTSRTGILLHSIIDEDDYYLGGFYIMNKEYTDKFPEWYSKVKA